MCNKAIYLDHNASTPMDPVVLATVISVMQNIHANPSSIEHVEGNLASKVVETAREKIAYSVGCRPKEIIFTSGSTEANNLAILGSYPELRRVGKTHLITSQIEHPSVLACLSYLEENGAEVTRLGVNDQGEISLEELRKEMSDKTGLVSIMAANNETGVLQPLNDIGAICEEFGALFHTDYSQASAYIPLSLADQPIHMASFSGHKTYGPKGVGALYRSMRKPRVKLEPIILGGGQELGLRSGTMNTPGIAGLGEAFSLIKKRYVNDCILLSGMRDRLQDELLDIGDVRINGFSAKRLPNSLSVSIGRVEPLALMHATKNEIIFSASSACSTGKVEASHVLKAMFGDVPRSREAFRLGLGRGTTSSDINQVSRILKRAVTHLRSQRISS